MINIRKGIVLLCGVSMFAGCHSANAVLPELPPEVKVSYPDSNPFREALQPMPETAIFKMDGYYLWDPSVIKEGDTYHLFCSRWPVDEKGMQGWKYSHVIRAESKSLLGPYTFKEVVLHPDHHPWATRMIHNPKIMKVGDQYLLYHIGAPGFATGFAYADSVTGPWKPERKPALKANNPAILIREDGSVYGVSKIKPKPPKDGRWDACMTAWEAPSLNGPYTRIRNSENVLPNDFEMEDPTIWWANDQYNVICTDWEAKATGIEKAPLYYTSKDGAYYTLYSQIPILDQVHGIPMQDETTLKINGFERPQVFLNEKNEVIALLGAIRPEEEGTSYVVIVPVDHFMPGNE